MARPPIAAEVPTIVSRLTSTTRSLLIFNSISSRTKVVSMWFVDVAEAGAA
jgi:hypothetical protein